MMEHVMMWIGPGLDVAAVALLTLVLWRLGRDPGAAWGEREARLQVIFDDLRGLVAQSEGLARDLDEKLAGRETRLRALLSEAQTALTAGEETRAPRPHRVEVRDDAVSAPPSSGASVAASASADPAVTARRIEALAEEGVTVEEIARRVGVATAEVRLVIGLKAVTARRRTAGSEAARAHA